MLPMGRRGDAQVGPELALQLSLGCCRGIDSIRDGYFSAATPSPFFYMTRMDASSFQCPSFPPVSAPAPVCHRPHAREQQLCQPCCWAPRRAGHKRLLFVPWRLMSASHPSIWPQAGGATARCRDPQTGRSCCWLAAEQRWRCLGQGKGQTPKP